MKEVVPRMERLEVKETLRMKLHEEQPQRPRVRSLDKDTFCFEQRQQEETEKKEALALLRKGRSGGWGEGPCAWKREKEEPVVEKVKLCKSHLCVLPLDRPGLSLDRT